MNMCIICSIRPALLPFNGKAPTRTDGKLCEALEEEFSVGMATLSGLSGSCFFCQLVPRGETVLHKGLVVLRMR